MAVLTIFTTCKPFRGEFETIQANALQSWTRLNPAAEVLVFGDEPGVAEHCRLLGIQQIGDMPRSEYGTPLLNGLFHAAEKVTTTPLLAFVNADIMLTPDLLPAIERTQARFDKFLLMARRWNVEVGRPWDFSDPEWHHHIRTHARRGGELEPIYGGIDLFVYPRGMWTDLPPFAIGRGRWDSALIYLARKQKTPVIDATEVVTCVHQNHGYGHHPQSTAGVFKGPESFRNIDLLGGEEFIFTSLNASHVLREDGIKRRRNYYPPYLLRELATFPALYAPLKPFAPVVRKLAPVWRSLRIFNDRFKKPDPQKATKAQLYPCSIAPLPAYSPHIPAGGGVETFDTPEATAINQARMDHLRSLGLALKGKTVLDVGCGVGHLAQLFVQLQCNVLCVDGRQENIDRLHKLYPDRAARVFDVEADDIAQLGSFDIVFAYGLLYHLENPFRSIKSLGLACKELLILETVIADHHLPLVCMREETATFSQALAGLGCRPTPSFVVLALRTAGFRYVYAPKSKPDHRDFHFDWNNDLSDSRDGHLLRAIFIASRTALDNASLMTLLAPA